MGRQFSQNDEVSEGTTCVTPNCNKPAKWKGLCSACYGAAKKLIDDEQTSWDELIEMGMAIDKTSLFRNEFKRRKQGTEEKKCTCEDVFVGETRIHAANCPLQVKL
jgi:hypothetical protein